MLRHIVDNGTWDTKANERITPGVGIAQYVNNDDTFKATFLGDSRENANNHESSRSLTKVATHCLIRTRFLGCIITISNEEGVRFESTGF